MGVCEIFPFAFLPKPFGISVAPSETVLIQARFFLYPCISTQQDSVSLHPTPYPALPTLALVSSLGRFLLKVQGILPGKLLSCLCFNNPAYRSTGCSTLVRLFYEINNLLDPDFLFLSPLSLIIEFIYSSCGLRWKNSDCCQSHTCSYITF